MRPVSRRFGGPWQMSSRTVVGTGRKNGDIAQIDGCQSLERHSSGPAYSLPLSSGR